MTSRLNCLLERIKGKFLSLSCKIMTSSFS